MRVAALWEGGTHQECFRGSLPGVQVLLEGAALPGASVQGLHHLFLNQTAEIRQGLGMEPGGTCPGVGVLTVDV